MLEAWHQAAEGRLPMDTRIALRNADKVGGSGVLRGLGEGMSLSVADVIHLMIVLSDNTATNMLIERLGTARINTRLESYGLSETKLFRPTFRDGKPDVPAGPRATVRARHEHPTGDGKADGGDCGAQGRQRARIRRDARYASTATGSRNDPSEPAK